ncbi:uncharacterized protein LOC144475207 isoform X1 [Augochlora pura]
MARVCVYERSVTSILTDVSFYKNLNHIAARQSIKREPSETDDGCQDDTLSLTNTNSEIATTVETVVQETQLLEDAINTEYKLVLSEDCADVGISDVCVIDTRKRKRLTFENLNVSEKRAKIGSESPEPRKTAIECGVCFLKFESLEALKIHTDIQTEVTEPYCDKCHTVCKSPYFLNDRKWVCRRKNNLSNTGRVLFYCRFCKDKYRTKSKLQCHVFHNHGKLLPCSAEKSVNRGETDKPSKIKDIDSTDKTSETDQGKTRETDNTKTTGKIDDTIESSSVQQNENDKTRSSARKIRQTSMTRFLSGYTGVITDACSNKVYTSKKAEPAQNRTITEKIDYYINTPRRAGNRSLIKIRIDYDTMTRFGKNIKAEIKDEPNASPNYNTRHVTRSSLKQFSDDLNTTPVIQTPRRINTPREKPKHRLSEEELRAKFKCKDCKLNLVRCDAVKEKETAADRKRVYISLVKIEELKKVKDKESFQCSEVLDASQEVTRANSRTLFRCKVCKKCFSWKKNLRKHFELRHVFFKSCICDAECKTKVELQRHYVNKHGCFKHMWCCVCFKRFSSLAILRQHLVLHCFQVLLPKGKKQRNKGMVKCRMPCKKSSCKACGKRYWLKSCLKEHQRVCTKMLAREKQNVSNAVKANLTLDDANIELDASQPNIRLIDDEYYSVESSSLDPSKRIAYANGYNIDGSGINKSKLTCTICRMRFRNFRNLCIHEQSYSKTTSYICTICNTAFSTLAILKHHYRFTHTVDVVQNYKYYCTFCAQGFMKKERVQIHRAHFHAGQISFVRKPWLTSGQILEVTKVCRVCHLVFESSEQFTQHSMFYYKGQMFTCTYCSETFYGMYMLRNHIKLEHKDGDTKKQYTYMCNICSEGFNSESHYHAHKSHVHSVLDVKIPQHLEDHNYVEMSGIAESINEPIRKYNCDICYTSFITEEDMRQHKMESHKAHFHSKTSAPQHDNSNQIFAYKSTGASGNVTDTFVCTICSMKFENLEKLEFHFAEYSNEGSYNCLICDRHFSELRCLEIHKLNHTNLNFILSKYHCPVCREGFANKINVWMHTMHFHRSVAVEQIKDRDVQKALLLNEITVKLKTILNSQPKRKSNSRSKRKPTCFKCLSTFNTARALKDHAARYTYEGSYGCEKCGRKFRFAKLLSEHMRKHAISIDRLKFSCPFCDDRFGNSIARYQHVVHLHWNDIWEGRVPSLTIRNDPETGVDLTPIFGESFDAICSMNESSDIQESSAAIDPLAINDMSTQEETQTENTDVKASYENCPFCDVRCSSLTSFMAHLKNEHDQKPKTIVYNPCSSLLKHGNHLTINIFLVNKTQVA